MRCLTKINANILKSSGSTSVCLSYLRVPDMTESLYMYKRIFKKLNQVNFLATCLFSSPPPSSSFWVNFWETDQMSGVGERSDQNNKMDRKTIERNRRLLMKDLCFRLTSLIPHQHLKSAKEFLPQKDQFDRAASYIKQLRESIEELKRRKRLLSMSTGDETDNNNTTRNSSVNNETMQLPILRFKDLGSSFEVVLINGLEKKFTMYQVIGILEEGGAEVVTASVSRIGNHVFHTLHAKAKVSRVGVDTSGIFQRLQALIS